MTDTNLTEAYRVPVRVAQNPVSGSFELCASFCEADIARQNLLIEMICHNRENHD